MMPNDLPPWHTVYQQTQRWMRASVFEDMVRALRMAVNDQGVTSADDLHRFLAEWPINDSVALTIVRWQDRLTVEITPVKAK